MKHPTPQELVAIMLQAALKGEGEIRNCETGETMGDKERFGLEQQLVNGAMAIRFMCVECGEDLSVDETKTCVCGNFCCADHAVDDGPCSHQAPEDLAAEFEALKARR